MSFNYFTDSLSKKFEELSTTVSQKTQEISRDLPSIAQSTQRIVQEKLGQVTDISQLPQEYLELENKIDNIKLITEQFLQITTIYENESYDYPKYIKDSMNNFSETVINKVSELSHVTSAQEVQNVLVTPQPTKEPMTLNFALSKMALNSIELINANNNNNNTASTNGNGRTLDDKLIQDLLQFSNLQTQIGQARLEQDRIINNKINKKLKDNLNNNLQKAMQVRKDVYNKRLQYDIARTNLLNAKPEKEASLRVQMESLEDQFAQVTENATIVMQEVIKETELLLNVKQFAEAQLQYFEKSASFLRQFVDTYDGTDVDDSKN